jgi:hypothetical protein
VTGFVLAGYLEVLFLRARLAEPSRWDAWAFWMPKAMSIVHFDGLDTRAGGFTSFANPDYPPLKPAIDAAAFRFLGDVDPGAVAVQNWIVAAAFFGAVAALLAPRVRPAILWPSLALLALLPDFGLLVASLLADESLALLFALAGVCGALWLVEKEVRFAALAAFFLATAALVKNEGLMLALVLFVLLAAVTRGRPWRQLLALAALPIIAVVPWRLWMNANGVRETSAFRLEDLGRPQYLLDRTDRLGTALHELPRFCLLSTAGSSRCRSSSLPRRHSSGVVRRSRRTPSARSFSAFWASRPSTGRARIHSSGTSTLRPTASFHRSSSSVPPCSRSSFPRPSRPAAPTRYPEPGLVGP